MNWSDVGVIISLIGAIMSLVIAWRKTPIEIRGLSASAKSTDADTATKYQQIASLAAEKALKLNERIDELECEIEKVKDDLKKAQDENEDLREWAGRLVHQVISLGGKPVEIRKREKNENTTG